VATKQLLSLAVLLPLLASGCGGGDAAEAKQAALEPAVTAAAVDEAPSPAATATAPVDSGAVAVATPEPSSAAPAPEAESNTIGRESFSYTGGSRDPFVSLLANSRVGPELPDLLLVSISYDTRNPAASLIVMREKVGNKRYTLRPGDRLGRLRVASIRPKDVTFTIDDFGTERQQVVSLRKQEETQ